jgi:hypothetical protein
MSKLLSKTFKFDEQISLQDKGATRKNILKDLKYLVKKTEKDDWLVFYYSGHGTWVPDVSGDEPDGRDEALYVYGRRKKDRILLDDDLREVISKLADGANLLVISDSCHSGTVTRVVAGSDDAQTLVKKFVPPEGVKVQPAKIVKRFGAPKAKMNHILISGCSPTEYSYEAKIGNVVRGVFTHRLTNIMRKDPKATVGQWYTRLRKKLPNGNFPQTPQLDCAPIAKKKRLCK